MQFVNLDIAEKGISPVIHAKQGDVGRKFKAAITSNRQPYPIPADARFSVWYSGAGGQGNYSAIGNKPAFEVSGNAITVELIAQMLTAPGGGTFCLTMHDSKGNQIGFWNLYYVVEEIPGVNSKPAEQYYTAFSESVGQVLQASSTDPTLSVPGRAADAAETGKQLSGKAPAGLIRTPDTHIRSMEQLDAFLETVSDNMALYTVEHHSLSMDISSISAYGSGVLTVYKGMTAENILQIAAALQITNGDHLYKRGDCEVLEDGTKLPWNWEDWEWENPPMELNREYRTTERWSCHPVYTKMIDCGLSSGFSQIQTGITDVIRYSGIIGNLPLPYLPADGFNGQYVAWINVNAGFLEVHTKGFSPSQVYAQLWYIKP